MVRTCDSPADGNAVIIYVSLPRMCQDSYRGKEGLNAQRGSISRTRRRLWWCVNAYQPGQGSRSASPGLPRSVTAVWTGRDGHWRQRFQSSPSARFLQFPSKSLLWNPALGWKSFKEHVEVQQCAAPLAPALNHSISFPYYFLVPYLPRIEVLCLVCGFQDGLILRIKMKMVTTGSF